jgi:O-antigen/teichoic acid export membrane protein
MTGRLRAVAEHPLLKGFGAYFASSILNRSIPLLLLPVLTRYLAPEDYGLLSVFQALMAFLVPVIGMNLHANITRVYFREPLATTAGVVYNALVVLLVSGALGLAVLGAVVLVSGPVFGLPPSWLLALPLLAVTNMVGEMNLTILRNQQRPLAFAGYELSRTALDFGLTLLLVVAVGLGWQGRAVGIAVASGHVRPGLNRAHMNSILGISLPLVPHALGSALISFSDRVVLERTLGAAATGVYTVGYQFGTIMQLVVTALSRTWSPWFYKELAQDTLEARRRVARATMAVAAALLVTAGLVTLAAGFLLPVLTPPEYHGATAYVGWVAFALALFGMYSLLHPHLVLIGKTAYLGAVTFSVALMNVALTFFLVQRVGAIGAAQATFAAYLLLFVLVAAYVQRVHPMPWLAALRRSRD